jgi:hypothetical protein
MTASTETDEGSRTGTGGRLPDFFIVGHPKSGTTALYEMLRSHPQVFMPDVKEPRFFAEDLRPRFQGAGRGSGGERLPETLQEYLALFAAARPEQVVGEASPSYLRSLRAAELIAAARPEAKIIAILREPASFLRSLHMELVQNHVESEQDLRKALQEEWDSPAGQGAASGQSGLPRYTDRVRYVEQLRRYHEVFPPEQVLVLIYEDFRADNEATVRRVLRFLGVDETVLVAPVEANPSVHVRSLALDRAMRSLRAGQSLPYRAAKRAVKALTPQRVQAELLPALRRRVLYSPPRAADEALEGELRERFRDEVAALGEYLDRDLLKLWSYGGGE